MSVDGFAEQPDTAVVADLARRAEIATPVVTGEPDDLASFHVLRVRDDEHLETVDLERQLVAPRRPQGSATLHDPVDFFGYVNRISGRYTTCWADLTKHRITAVFNDRAAADEAGWRDHTATLALQLDPEWSAWVGRDGKLGDQASFGEFIEDRAGSVVAPDAATMYEVATTFKAARKATFESSVRLRSGDVDFTFREETTASAGRTSKLEVPEQFTIRVAPFLGVDAVDITARLRHRIDNGALLIGYRLHRPDLVIREAFDRIRASVVENLANEVPVLLGEAPSTSR